MLLIVVTSVKETWRPLWIARDSDNYHNSDNYHDYHSDNYYNDNYHLKRSYINLQNTLGMTKEMQMTVLLKKHVNHKPA